MEANKRRGKSENKVLTPQASGLKSTSWVKKALLLVIILNLGYFFVEFFFAFAAESVALFSDSIDFLEDSALNILILLALGSSALVRVRVSRVLAIMMLIPASAGAWMAISKILDPVAPEASWITLVGVGALVVNVTCALIISKSRGSEPGLLMAAFFAARNDALANIGIIVAGVATMFWVSAIPDIFVGLVIMALNADSAFKIWTSTSSTMRTPD